jgi:transposase
VLIGDCPAWVCAEVGHVSDTELLHKSKPESVHRLEVFTGTGRRRAWTAERKAQIVAESFESGETVCAVARRHALTPQQLFGWRRAARRRTDDGTPAFAPVIVEAAPRCASASQARSDALPVIEIVIGTATVRVAPGTDAANLQAVLRAVMAVA